MSGLCCLRTDWKQEEIISLQENISVNLTQEISRESSLNTTVAVFTGLTYAFEVFGIICNVVSFIVLSRPAMKSAFGCCLMFLTGFDTIFLFSFLGKSFSQETAVVAIFTILLTFAWTGSVWTTVTVSVERFIAIFFALRAKLLCTYKRTLFFNLFVSCFAVGFNIPLFVVLQKIFWKGDLMKTYLYLYNTYGLQATSYMPSWFFRNKVFFEVSYLYLNIAVMYCLPLISLAVLRTCICIGLRKAKRIRQEMTQYQGGIKKLNRFRVFNGIVTIFAITYFPALILSIPYCKGILPVFVYASESLCYLLITANSSMKFVIYCTLWKDFRCTMRNMLPTRHIQNVVIDDNATRACSV